VVTGEEDVVGVDPPSGRLQLVEHDLEPELIGLVGDDEQELVVLAAQALLEPQQLRHLQVRAIGELASFLAEPAAHECAISA